MGGRDHPGARKPHGSRESIDPKTHEVGHEEEEPTATRDEGAVVEGECTDIRCGLDGGPWPLGSLLVEPAGKRSEALFVEHLADGGRAQGHTLSLQGLADLVDGVVALAQSNDQVACSRLPRTCVRSRRRSNEEDGIGIATEVMAEDAEGPGRVPEAVGHLRGGTPLDVLGAEGLVDTLSGVTGGEEETAALS